MNIKVYYFAPHPVQYHMGLYKAITKSINIDFEVIYEDSIGIKPVYVKEFNKTIQWDMDLLQGHKYLFLKNFALKSQMRFFGRINFGIVPLLYMKRPDVVVIHGYSYLSDFIVLFLSKILKIKVVFRGEATLRKDKSKSTIKQRMKYLFLKKWLGLCDVVMYSCSGNKEYWKHFNVDENKLIFLPCAVDNEFFRSENKKYIDNLVEHKNMLNITSDKYVILFSARFTSRKRPLDLMKALTLIDSKNIVLLFVGDGPERSKMECYSKENGLNSVFVGFKNQSEISKYYALADLNVVISDYDPSPKAMNEAMNFSLPIIVTDVVGTSSDLVRDNENGYIIEVGDIENLALKIDYLNKNRDVSKKMGENSLSIVDNWTYFRGASLVEYAINYVIDKNE